MYDYQMSSRNHRFLFDQAAVAYDEARPGYPRELIDKLAEAAQLPARARILEIGCGTGQMTRSLAERGYEIAAIELGEHLARLAANNLEVFPNVQVVHSSFEEWVPTESAFDVVLSAQAFHWIDPAISYPKIRSLLKGHGHLAVVYNLFTGGTGPVYEDLDRVYRHYFPKNEREAASTSLQSTVDRTLRMIKGCELFQDPVIWSHPWVETYSTDRHIKLLESFSDHRSLDVCIREALFREVRDAIDKHGGIIERPLEATLFVAQVV